MAIDSSIYRNQSVPDLMGAASQGLSMRDMIEKRNETKALKQAYKSGVVQNPDGTASIDQGKTFSALAGVDPQAAQQFQAQAQTQKIQMDQAQKQKLLSDLDLTNRMLGGVKDQQSWQMAMQSLQKSGVDVGEYANTPFDPGLRDHLLGMGLTAQDRLDQDLKQAQIGKLKAETGKIGREASGANFGSAPQGYRFKQDGSLEAIPGGPAAQNSTEKAEKEKQSQQLAAKQASLVHEDIERSLERTEPNILGFNAATGPLMGRAHWIPGAPADTLDTMLDSIKANVGFDKLQAMRNASPTGGALGSVSDAENKMLQAAMGSIDTRLPNHELRYNLMRLANVYSDIVHGPGNGPGRYDLTKMEKAKGQETLKGDQIQWMD